MVKVVAEAGVNHNGNLDTAMRLVVAAKEAGCDAVKFQTFWHFDHLKELELSPDEFEYLFMFAESVGIEWMSTPFSIEAIDFLENCGMKTWKIPSGLVSDSLYLDNIRLSSKGSPIILSTGMAKLNEVRGALFRLNTNNDITVLQCTTAYPCPYEEVNLRAMVRMRQILKRPVGLSDHTQGIEVSIAAIALGAQVIEKHITLDRGMDGPDHTASIEPKELSRLVSSVRNIEVALGSAEKKPTPTELGHRDEIRHTQAIQA